MSSSVGAVSRPVFSTAQRQCLQHLWSVRSHSVLFAAGSSNLQRRFSALVWRRTHGGTHAGLDDIIRSYEPRPDYLLAVGEQHWRHWCTAHHSIRWGKINIDQLHNHKHSLGQLTSHTFSWPSFGKGENKSQLIDIVSQPHQTMFQYTDTTL